MKYQNFNFPVYTDFNRIYAISYQQIVQGVAYTLLNPNINSSLNFFFENPSEFVLSLRYYPIDFLQFTGFAFVDLKVGNNTYIKDTQNNNVIGWDLHTCYINQSFLAKLKVAEIEIERKFNNFLDFNPYTRIELDLPFSSPVELNPIDCYGYTIEVYYIPDFNTGKATIYIQNEERLLYTTQATIGVDIPLGNTNAVENLRNQVNNIIGIGTGITQAVVGTATGNPFSITSGIGLISSAIQNSINNNITKYTPKGQGSGVGNQFTNNKVTLIIQYPKLVNTTEYQKIQYNHLYGKPLLEFVALNTLSGYTEIEEIHLTGFNTALKEEVDEIESLLKEGVIL